MLKISDEVVRLANETIREKIKRYKESEYTYLRRKCSNCGKSYGRHRAITNHCPINYELGPINKRKWYSTRFRLKK